MIFQHTWEKVLSGEKTQTRRIVKPHDYINRWHLNGDDDCTINEILTPRKKPTKYETSRNVYLLGKTYAVQPGRGQKAIAHIEITDIRHEDVRCISDEDARAEGFDSPLDFLAKWTQMHDRQMQFDRDDENWADDGTWNYWANRKWGKADSLVMWSYLAVRPANRFMAWALTFKLVQA